MRMKRAVAAVAAVMVVALSAAPALAATAPPPPGPLNVNPSEGLAGSSFTASQDVSPDRFCPVWSVTFFGVPEGVDDATSPHQHEA